MRENSTRRHQDLLRRGSLDCASGAVNKKVVIRHDLSPVLLRRDCPIPEAGHRSAAVTGWPKATRRVEERAQAREQRSALTARTGAELERKRRPPAQLPFGWAELKYGKAV